MEGSHCFGPLAAAAGTEQDFTTYNMPPKGPWNIFELRVGFANVVNAKESAGYVRIQVDGELGDYYYVVGKGTGGATNAGAMPAQTIQCSINAESAAKVTASIYNGEAIKDAVVSIAFRKGRGREVRTYRCGGAGTDVVAGTEKTIGTMPILKAGTLRQIRFTGSGIVDALAETGKLTLEIPGQGDVPHEWAVGHGASGAATTANQHCDVITLKHGIPLDKNITITAKFLNLVTTGAALLSCGVSIQVS